MSARLPPFDDEELRNAERTLYAEARVVRFQDVDAAGVLPMSRVLEYFHDAYIAFLGREGIDIAVMLRAGEAAVPLVAASGTVCEPIGHGDRLTVEIVAARASASSFALGHRLRRGETVVAMGRTVHVSVDRRTFTKVPMPPKIRAALV